MGSPPPSAAWLLPLCLPRGDGPGPCQTTRKAVIVESGEQQGYLNKINSTEINALRESGVYSLRHNCF